MRTYEELGQYESALSLQRDVYLGFVKLYGEDDASTLTSSLNYTSTLIDLKRFKEAKSLLRTTMPVARCALGEGEAAELRMRSIYACTLYNDPNATLDDLCESVATLEETTRIARRVFGGAHPIIPDFEGNLEIARAALRAREGDVDALREGVEELRVKK